MTWEIFKSRKSYFQVKFRNVISQICCTLLCVVLVANQLSVKQKSSDSLRMIGLSSNSEDGSCLHSRHGTVQNGSFTGNVHM